jgi:transcriptional accessory protein Tex/SPT6
MSYNFFMNQHNIDTVFFLSGTKRNSVRHISRHRENIDPSLVEALVRKMEEYFIQAMESIE